MPNLQTHFASLHQDAITWKAGYIYNQATNPADKAAAIDAIAATITCIPGVTAQTTYAAEIEHQLKLKKNIVAKAIEQLQKQKAQKDKKRRAAIDTSGDEEGGIESEQESKMPKWVTKEDEQHWRRHGYFPCNKTISAPSGNGGNKKIGYYSINVRQTEAGPAYNTTEITNFLTTPIMHVYKGEESRHIIEITNGYVTAVKEIPSKIIPSREQFQAALVTEGSFAIFGSNLQWLRIASELLHKFPRCIELEDLGFHPAGFFAYSDYIHQPGIGKIEVDGYGILESGGKKYLLPQQSEAFAQLRGTGGDPFENDRVLTYKLSPVTFQQWTEKVNRVYGIQGTVAIAYCIFTLFRDIVARVTGTSPHLYLYGPPQSGKSVLAETIYSLFYINRNFFIAYEGTVPAFYTYLTRFINCPAVVNEVDADTTDPDRLQAFKGAFDLEGREKMNIAAKSNKRSTTIQRINSSLVLVGQYIITNDNNAILTRSIIEDFLPNDSRTTADIHAFDELKQLGKQGITSLLTELVNMRPYFDTNFRSLYLAQLDEWIKQTSQKGRPLMQRIMNNYAILATCYKILNTHYPSLKIKHAEFTGYCLKKATQWSQFVSSSDSLSEFWRYITHMYESGVLKDHADFIIEKSHAEQTREGKALQWDAGEYILYLRINNVHKLYQLEYRKRTGKDGISIENLGHYFKSKKYYLGKKKDKRFRRFFDTVEQIGELQQPHKKITSQEVITSCDMFLYTDLQNSIEGFHLGNNGAAENPNIKQNETTQPTPAQNFSFWQQNPGWG